MKRYYLAALLFISSIVPVSSFAWWGTGHMLVAGIAYKYLTPNARIAVNHLLQFMPNENNLTSQYTYNPQNPILSFMTIAHWPDDLKTPYNSLILFNEWHFHDQYFSGDGTPIPKYTNPENVAWAIPLLEKNIQNTQANLNDRVRSLAFFVHFVGDAHQPLHCVSRVSYKHPKGDEGGNLYPINYTTTYGLKISDLHSLWDSGLLLFTSKKMSPVQIDQIANQMIRTFPPSVFGSAIYNLNPIDWTQDGFNLGRLDAYALPQHSTPSAQYIKNNTTVIKLRIALAGYRLANMLNQMFA